MLSMFKRFSVILALAGIGLAVMLVKKVRHVEPPAPPLVEPAHAPFADSIGARGLVESFQENVRIAPSVPGLVMQVKVKVGDSVKKGDLLFVQDTREAEALVQVQKAQIEAIQSEIEQAKVALADRQDTADRVNKLIATKVSSIDEQQRARFAVQAAASLLTTRQAEFAVAQMQLTRSQVQLELLSTKAPRDATVLQVNLREGEYAAPNAQEAAILLGQTEMLQLRADVDEDSASRVKDNCRAVAYIKGRRSDEIPLEFVRIEPYIVPKRSLTGESSERVDTRVLQIIFRFKKSQTPVYVGQQMDVFIDGADKSDKSDR